MKNGEFFHFFFGVFGVFGDGSLFLGQKGGFCATICAGSGQKSEKSLKKLQKIGKMRVISRDMCQL